MDSATTVGIASMKKDYDNKKENVQKMLIELVLKVNTKVAKARLE